MFSTAVPNARSCPKHDPHRPATVSTKPRTITASIALHAWAKNTAGIIFQCESDKGRCMRFWTHISIGLHVTSKSSSTRSPGPELSVGGVSSHRHQDGPGLEQPPGQHGTGNCNTHEQEKGLWPQHRENDNRTPDAHYPA